MRRKTLNGNGARNHEPLTDELDRAGSKKRGEMQFQFILTRTDRGYMLTDADDEAVLVGPPYSATLENVVTYIEAVERGGVYGERR